MMRIGGFVSTAGGVDSAPGRGMAIGANCLLFFVGSNRSWRPSSYSDEQIAGYREACKRLDLGPNFIHALYLANLATDNEELTEKSIAALVHALNMSATLGVAGVIFHTGSRKERDSAEARADVIDRIQEILRGSGEQSTLIIENSAGQGGSVGSTFDELGEIVRRVGSPRLKVCLDTQHAFAAGYDVRTPQSVDKMVTSFDRSVGIDELVVIHANDSKQELGSDRDRHENIGDGLIGTAGFQALLHHPALRALPWLLEVPGIHGTGPDLENIRRLQVLAK